jgi:hypothetical protein
MGSFSGNPPLPTNDGGLGSPDPAPVNTFSPTTIFNDSLNNLGIHADDLKALVGKISGVEDLFAKLLAFLIKTIGEVWIDVLKELVPLEVDYNNALTDLHKRELPIGVPAAREMIGDELALILGALGNTSTANYAIPGSDITQEGEAFFTALVQPFALWANTADPSQFGSGFQNAQFLLRRALALSLGEYTIDSMSNLIGFGWVKALQPMLGFLDRSINPSNVVRQSMEQAYSFLMKAPMQRDLNHLYPIKDLGVTALSKLYIRGAIDQQTYLDKCLDAGLSNQWATQLVVETAKLLSTSQIGTLLNHGFINEDDARQQLLEQGYPDWQATALLYLETHSRYFSIQERVGNEAVTAWKKGIIDQTQLESLLQSLGYTADEIALLEIEGQFVKNTTDQKDLTYSQMKQLFEANLIGIDEVITYLQGQGYSQQNTTNLILLDFVKAEERAIRRAELIARVRVQAEAERTLAAAELAKNQTDLANARIALADELDAAQKQLGLLQSLPSIMDLIGITL